MALDTYAILNGDLIDNVTVCDSSTFAKDQGWIDITNASPMPGIGWTTPDGGSTWVAPPQPPQVMTGASSNVTATGVTVSGTVMPSGQDTVYYFEYGTTAGYGTQTASADAGSGTSSVDVSEALSGLTASTEYHYRLVASNAAGVAQGADQTFTTTA